MHKAIITKSLSPYHDTHYNDNIHALKKKKRERCWFRKVTSFHTYDLFRSANRSTKKELEKALEAQMKRSSELAVKLKQMRADNKKLRESKSRLDESSEVMPRHSTMREEFSGSQSNSLLMTSMNTLSVASLNIPECKPAETEDDIDRKTFETWKELLEASMDLIGVTDESTKMNVLKVKAGPKLLEVLDGTPPQTVPNASTAPYSNAMRRLKDFFGSREYNLMQRQKLRTMAQIPDEPDTKYVKRVIAAAKLCDFEGEKLMENVAEVIQLHALNIKVREAGRKILRKGGSLTELIDKVQGYELDKKNEEIFAKTHPPAAEMMVAAVAHGHPQPNYQRPSYHGGSFRGLRGRNIGLPGRGGNWQNFRGNSNFRRRTETRAAGERGTDGVPCWRCTSRFHSPNNCHAIPKVCRNCQVVGHIERACNTMPSPAIPKRRISDEGDSTIKPKKIALVSKEENETEETNTVSDYST